MLQSDIMKEDTDVKVFKGWVANNEKVRDAL